jgi:cell division protein FtsB
MRHDEKRRLTDRVDDFGFDLKQLEALVRVLRRELSEQRARVRELEHQIDDLTAARNGARTR